MAVDLDAVKARWWAITNGEELVPFDTWSKQALISARDVPALVDELERLRAAVALHREARISLLPEVPAGWCAECEQLWPCPSVTTAEGGGQ